MFELAEYSMPSPALTEGYSPSASVAVSKDGSPMLSRSPTVSYEAVCVGGAGAFAREDLQRCGQLLVPTGEDEPCCGELLVPTGDNSPRCGQLLVPTGDNSPRREESPAPPEVDKARSEMIRKDQARRDRYSKERWQSIVENPDFHERVKGQKRAWYRKITGSNGSRNVQSRKYKKDMTAQEWDRHRLGQYRVACERHRRKRCERLFAFAGVASEIYGHEQVKTWSRAGLERGIAPWSWESLVYAAEVLEPVAMEQLRVEERMRLGWL